MRAQSSFRNAGRLRTKNEWQFTDGIYQRDLPLDFTATVITASGPLIWRLLVWVQLRLGPLPWAWQQQR